MIGVIRELPNLVANASPWETALGLLTIAILFLYPKSFKKVMPPQLVALVVGTVVSLTLLRNIDIRTIATIGKITPGLPQLQLPNL